MIRRRGSRPIRAIAPLHCGDSLKGRSSSRLPARAARRGSQAPARVIAYQAVGRAAEGAPVLEAARERGDRERAARREPRARTRPSRPTTCSARSVEVTARCSGRAAPRSGSRRTEPRDLVARASYGYTPDDDPAGQAGAVPTRARARVARRAHGPFVLEPTTSSRRTPRAPPIAVAPLRDRAAAARRHRVAALTATIGGRDRRPPAAPARRPRAPGEARDRERRALREPRAHLRLDRRGARERARGERRVHVVARPLDHRHGAARRRGARPRPRRAEAARARRALPRHRQDRDPVEHPARSPAR